MKKVLIVSTVSRQFFLFEKGNIEILKSLGFEVHAAANYEDENYRLNDLDIIRHHFEIERSPFSLKNIKAYKQLKRIIKDEKFNIIHCHSPMGGVLTRLAANSLKISPVLYTAHGFHFYKGSPFLNWLIYYPVEKFLSRITDVLITINNEDYKRAKKLHSKNVEYVPGIGIDAKKFSNKSFDNKMKRSEFNIPSDAFVLLSVGELNKNKNHEVIIDALTQIQNKNIFYLICGKGERESFLKEKIESFGFSERVKLLGFRDDLPEIYNAADLFVFPSYREGLSVALMEAMASGLPVICSEIRGNTDLIKDNKGGLLTKPYDVNGFADNIIKLSKEFNLRNSMGAQNKKVVKDFDVNVIKNSMKKIYSEVYNK